MEILLSTVLLLLSGSGGSMAELREKRADDSGPLEVMVQQLSQQVTSLAAQNSALGNQLTQVNNEIAALKVKTNTLGTTVAFHAWGSTNPIHTIPQGALILDHVTTNIGNAYDASTGVFSAPMAGLYVFQAVILEYSLSGAVRAGIYVDGHLLCNAISDNRSGGNYDQSPLTAVTHLNAGSKVVLKNTDAASAAYYSSLGEPYTTFSGFLVKAD